MAHNQRRDPHCKGHIYNHSLAEESHFVFTGQCFSHMAMRVADQDDE